VGSTSQLGNGVALKCPGHILYNHKKKLRIGEKRYTLHWERTGEKSSRIHGGGKHPHGQGRKEPTNNEEPPLTREVVFVGLVSERRVLSPSDRRRVSPAKRKAGENRGTTAPGKWAKPKYAIKFMSKKKPEYKKHAVRGGGKRRRSAEKKEGGKGKKSGDNVGLLL